MAQENVSSFTLKILQERGGEIRFIRALEDGTPCWFYLKITPEKQSEYEAKLKSRAMDIRDFGTILESDWGDYPPADVVKFMRDEYAFTTPPKPADDETPHPGQD